MTMTMTMTECLAAEASHSRMAEVHLAYLSGATWPELARKLGTWPHRVRAEYDGWVEDSGEVSGAEYEMLAEAMCCPECPSCLTSMRVTSASPLRDGPDVPWTCEGCGGTWTEQAEYRPAYTLVPVWSVQPEPGRYAAVRAAVHREVLRGTSWEEIAEMTGTGPYWARLDYREWLLNHHMLAPWFGAGMRASEWPSCMSHGYGHELGVWRTATVPVEWSCWVCGHPWVTSWTSP
jgi:hypothetical protein